jgi:hypothetical protein
MRWRKLGLVYGPDGSTPWAQSHAMIPTPVRLNEQIIRVFVTFCDAQGLGRPGYVDVDSSNPLKIIGVSKTPLLELGLPGTFDENGILTCSVIRMGDGRMLLYYAGFELGHKIRYRLLTGLAVSNDLGEHFERVATTPILERSPDELYFRGGPYCMREPDRFRLWYVAGSSWLDVQGKAMPMYEIRYAESSDGINWPSKGTTQIPITGPDEHGFGRPCVIAKHGGGFRMFYSIRRRSLAAYRLGYAESDNGYDWTRMDENLNLDVTAGGFDSDAIMYAAPIEVDGNLFVFYNGNDFGRSGFAVAQLETTCL